MGKISLFGRMPQNSSKNVLLAISFQNNISHVRFLQANTFLARSCHAKLILQRAYENLARNLFFGNFLQEIYIFFGRIFARNIFLVWVLQEILLTIHHVPILCKIFSRNGLFLNSGSFFMIIRSETPLHFTDGHRNSIEPPVAMCGQNIATGRDS